MPRGAPSSTGSATTRRRSRSRSRSAAVEEPTSNGKAGNGTRPHALPKEHANVQLLVAKAAAGEIKTQILQLEDGPIILIVRRKVPVPKGVSGHLIKRTDTDAVSASSLFRVAFPSATAEQEQQEMDWIATEFDTKQAGNDRDPSARLTGTWIPTSRALELADDYNLSQFVAELVTFTPPEDALRGSPANLRYPDPPFKKKNAQSPAATSSPPVRSSASAAEPPSAKRKRVKSPAPSTKPTSLTSASASTPSKASAAAAKADPVTPKVQVDVLVDGVSALDEPVAVPANVDELVEESKANALDLVASLKSEGKLDAPSSALSLKRTHDESNAIVALVEPARIEPRTRRYISLAGALALGAATFAAPYFLS